MLEGGGLKLRLKEHNALYKAHFVMHLHRLHNSLVNGVAAGLASTPIHREQLGGPWRPGMRGTLQGHPAAGIPWG